jgi:type III pantothenate kinase
MRTLLFDIGNTRLKWGLAEDGEIHRTGAVPQEKIRREGVSILSRRLPRRIDAAMASNVAGASFATRLSGFIGAHCDRELHFARVSRSAFGLTNGYRVVRRMGVDRWVAMIGAWSDLQSACLVVDAGTAVTIDAIDDDGTHLGGQILPGVRLMSEALALQTSDIPALKTYSRKVATDLATFATTTRAAIENGGHGAVVGAIEHAIRTLRSNAYEPVVVLTGGDASRILGALEEAPLHRPNLVLQGLLQMSDGHP